MKLSPDDIEIRPYRPGDEQRILETFNRCFSDVDPNFEPRTLESWRWQYLKNPSGWRIMLALAPDGAVVSQYAGVGQRVAIGDRRVSFSQAVDSMTDPAYRRGLKAPGFFVLTGRPYAELYGGRGEGQDLVMWGLPVPSAWRIGAKYLDYELVCNVNRLELDAERFGQVAAPGGVHIEPFEAFDEGFDDLFEGWREGRAAIQVRDAAHLRWRYDACPTQTYTRLRAVRDGATVGYLVVRPGAFDHLDGLLLCDHLTAHGDEEALLALLHAAVELARAGGHERILGMLPDAIPEYLTLQRAGFRVRTTSYFLVGRPYGRRYDMRWLYENWYYTLGDTDLV